MLEAKLLVVDLGRGGAFSIFGQRGCARAVLGVRRRMLPLQKPVIKDLLWDLRGEGAGAVGDFTVNLVTGYGSARSE